MKSSIDGWISRFMRSLIIITISLLFFTGCQAIPLRFGTWDVPAGSVLFQDDFSNPASGWLRLVESSGSESNYVDNAYRIFISESNRLFWSGPGLRFDNVRVLVQTIKITGPQDDDYGIVCRAKDKNNFYFLVISSDGYYGIGKVMDGVQTLLGAEAMQPSEAINQGSATNILRADCIGNTLTLFANEVQLARTEDAEFSSGDVGVLAGTFDSPGTEIYFRNFLVVKP